MDRIVKKMLDRLAPSTLFEVKTGIRQVAVEIILCALSRSGFFKLAALNGDTARRIQYGLDGFSHTLEFSLLKPDPGFRIEKFLPVIEKELRSYGLNFQSELKDNGKDSFFSSAYLYGNTEEHMLMLCDDKELAESVSDTDRIKVKIEVDTDPPLYAGYDTVKRELPVPFEVYTYDLPSLFAEKIDNTICRIWNSRTRGWDLYDFDFYMKKGQPVNLKHLWSSLLYSGYVEAREDMTLDEVKANLCYRFKEVNYERAKIDLLPFIDDKESLDAWSAEYFCGISEALIAVNCS